MTARAGSAPPASPYVGLRAFAAEDRGLFFGRARETRDVAALWQANRLTVLYGASGVGKTSLLQAGVIPRVSTRNADIWPVGRVAPRPAGTTGNPFVAALLASWSPEEEPAAGSLRDFVRGRPERVDRYGDPLPTLISIDQAEELFSDFPRLTEERDEFLTELAELLGERSGTGLRLLLSLREDYLAAVLPYENMLAQGARARFQLRPFESAAALEAARRPLEGTHRRFAAGAAETLVEDLRTIRLTAADGTRSTVLVDTVEPVQLQVVCAALWASLPSSVSKITSIHVREHADVDRFLARFCGRALSAVAAEHDLPASRIRAWLRHTFITELGTRGTAYEGLTQTAGMPNAVVHALEDRHILRAEQRSGSRWYELQHDRLIEPIRQADPGEHLQDARLALHEADVSLAQRQAELALAAAGDDLRIRAQAERLLGDIAVRRQDIGAAQARYRTAASLFEVLGDTASVGNALAGAGELSMRSGRHETAVAELQAAVTRIPTTLHVRTLLARALWHAGQPRAAVIVLNEALAIDGENVDALRARGEILADEGSSVEALSDLGRVRRHQGATTLAARALALAMSGKLEAAEQEAEDALANAEDDGPVLLRVAMVHALSGQDTSAARLAGLALSAAAPEVPPHLRPKAVALASQVLDPSDEGR
ncbi:hypothetical protein SMC26_00945 [Actinomadura fulvescens]|uniref:Novel STAND NTPase 1 domain-containing protein n=1 Tax=Actinomadura fulvescens TaxID=46160 RepID=A0ABN3PRM1_9ACTN